MNTSCSAVCDILDSTPSLKSKVPLPVSYARVTLCSVQYHDPHTCFHGSGACALVVLMAATDDDLQKLGRPPIYSGKEDEWNEWSFVMRSYVSLLSAHIPALLAGAEDTASPAMSMARIKDTLADDGITAAQKLFHVLAMNVRGPALTVIRRIAEEIRTEHSAESTKSHERNPQRADLPFGAHSL